MLEQAPEDELRTALTGLVERDARWQRLPGGRINSVWRVSGKSDRVVKLYSDRGDSPLFPNDSAAEVAMLTHLAGRGVAPENASRVVTTLGPCLIYDHVPGQRWQGGPETVARLLFQVHRLTPPAALRVAAQDPVAQGRAILRACGASLELPPPPPMRLTFTPRLIHTDPVPGNLIVDGVRIRLIDWQCPALGDPAEDLATFLSPGMQYLYRGAPLRPEEEQAFIAAYPDREAIDRLHLLRPHFHWRMAAHCEWKARQGAPDYACAAALERAAFKASSREIHRST